MPTHPLEEASDPCGWGPAGGPVGLFASGTALGTLAPEGGPGGPPGSIASGEALGTFV